MNNNQQVNAPKNKVVYDESGNRYVLTQTIGIGGQGAVFAVNGNDRIVIKALINEKNEILRNPERYNQYHLQVDSVMAKANIKHLAKPICMLKKPYCGYVMRFMSNMIPLEKLMLPGITPPKDYYKNTGGLKRRYTILRNLATILKDLYMYGLVYADLSPKNIFVSKEFSLQSPNCETWLIDVDNLHYANQEKKCVYTPEYGAPEVFLRKQNTVLSDVYSFALIAFEVLTMSKPFNGSIEDTYGKDDWEDETSTGDDGNQFVIDVQSGYIPFVSEEPKAANKKKFGCSMKDVFTPKVYDLFYRTLELGRSNPDKRPTICEWLDALTEACDNVNMTSECRHFSINAQCSMCDALEPHISIQSYRVEDMEMEDGVVQEEILEYTIRVNDQAKKAFKFYLPNYMLGDRYYDDSDAKVCIRKKDKNFVVDYNATDDILLKYSTGEEDIQTLDGLIINVYDNKRGHSKGQLLRKIVFSREVEK